MNKLLRSHVSSGRILTAASAGVALCLAGCISSPQTDRALRVRCGRMTALTDGPGHDTEAVWSPDGRRIAFQTDRQGDWDVAVLDVADGRVTPVAAGAGHACYPAWTPDGRLVYAFGHHPMTAVQAARSGADCGYGLRVWRPDGGTSERTQGYWRDYTPSVTADGAFVYYASTRGNSGNSAGVWRVPLDGEARAACVLPLDGGTVGAVQPSLSPDGRFLLWAQLDGFRENWRLTAAAATNLQESLALTPVEMSAYAPRWSPDGRLIAFTGFRAGDPGWGVYLLEPRSGELCRLATGRGHARSPAWSPDGRELVFENNRSGFYKLYRMAIRCDPPRAQPAEAPLRLDRVEARWDAGALVDAEGTRVPGAQQAGGALRFERPAGLDFGEGAFFVDLTLVVDRHEPDTRIAAVGQYAEHALGWQVFVRENRRLFFNARGPDGRFIGIESNEPVQAGRPVRVLGIRDADGSMRLYVDGRKQAGRASGATLCYGQALSVCFGQQWNGGMRLNGKVLAFACGRGYPPGVPRIMTPARLFDGEGAP